MKRSPLESRARAPAPRGLPVRGAGASPGDQPMRASAATETHPPWGLRQPCCRVFLAGASSRTPEERGLGTGPAASALRAEITCVTTRTFRRRRRLPRRRAVPVPMGVAVRGERINAWVWPTPLNRALEGTIFALESELRLVWLVGFPRGPKGPQIFYSRTIPMGSLGAATRHRTGESRRK